MSTIDKVGNYRKNYVNLAQLYAAIRRKERKKFIECILKNQDDINYKVPETGFLKSRQPELIGSTALHLAFGEYNYEVFNLLLDYHADFNVQNYKKMNLIHRAVVELFNSREMLKLRQRFNEYDRFFTLNDVNYFIVMQRVIEENNFEKYDNWRLWGAFEDRYIRSILLACVKLKNFIELPVDNGISHFHTACLTNDSKAIDYFLKMKVDVNKPSAIFYEYTPLHLAVKYSNFEIVKMLLIKGVNLSAKDTKLMSPLDILLDQNMKIIEWLHAKKKIPYKNAIVDYIENEKKMNAIITKFINIDPTLCFHVACAISSINIDFLESNYKSYSSSNFWHGYTALHFAAYFNIETVKILLKIYSNSKADIEAKDANGITPLDILVTRVTIDDLYFIVCHKESWKSVILSDGKTKLIDLILAMKDPSIFYNFMNEIDVNLHIPFDSPLWPGYTILHLVVTFMETTKKVSFLKNIFNTDRNNVLLEYENCCQEQENNYLERIEVCLDKNADVTVKNKRGWTPINLAFRQRKMEAVNLMLQNYNKTYNPIDDDNLSHLHIACLAKDNILVEKLISNGADVNAAIKSTFKWQCDYYNCTSTDVFDIIGSTPLHLSVSIEDFDLVKILLQNGADVNVKDSMGLSPLHRIFIQQHLWEIGNDLFKVLKVVTYILRRGRRSGIPTYKKAMEIGDNISKELLSSPNLKESIVEDFGLSHLHVAVYKNNVEAVKRLLALGSNINSTIKYTKKLEFNHPLYLLSRYNNYTPLHFARDQNIVELERILLKRGADILAKRADGTNRLFDKLENSYPENIGFFVIALKESKDLRKRLQDEFGWTILHVACQIIDLDLVTFAFEIGVDVNLRTNDNSAIYPGSTALHILMINGNKIIQQSDEIMNDHLRIFETLLGNGSNVMVTDTDGNTPLHRSNFMPGCIGNSYARSTYTARLLEQIEDVTINPTNDEGISIFHIACIRHDVTLIRRFLEHGVDVNQPVEFFSNSNLAGFTPLHLAARYRSESLGDIEFQLQAVVLLLKFKADVHAVNVFGDTPLHSATQCDPPRYAIIEKIDEYEADINIKNIYGKTPLELLLSSSQLSSREIEFFLNQGCRINTFNEITQAGYIPLLYRFHQKSLGSDSLRAVLNCPSINEINYMGRTAIHNVVSIPNYPNNDDIDVIGHLLNFGCDIDHQDRSGKTALHLAVLFRNSDAVEGLLMHESDINIVDYNGKTAFSYSLETESLCDFIDVGGHNHHLVIQILTRYIYHLTSRNHHVNDVNVQTLIRAFNEFAIDQTHIIDDYVKLKDVRIANTTYKLDDFLSETKAIVYYSKIDRQDREAIEIFFTITIEEHRFYEWKFLCKSQYNKALQRAELVENAKDAMNIVIGFPLPDLCFDVIEKFLSNKDLKCFIIAMT